MSIALIRRCSGSSAAHFPNLHRVAYSAIPRGRNDRLFDLSPALAGKLALAVQLVQMLDLLASINGFAG